MRNEQKLSPSPLYNESLLQNVFEELTMQEAKILSFMVKGSTNCAISNNLAISEKTVKNHITKLFRKLGVQSRAEALALVIKQTATPEGMAKIPIGANPDNFTQWLVETMQNQHIWEIIKRIRDWHQTLFTHSIHVAKLVNYSANHLYSMCGDDLAQITKAALLHDAGKIAMPPQFTSKKPLSAEEWYLMQSHTLHAEHIIRHYWQDVPELVIKIAKNHHERPGGSGYPSQIDLMCEKTILVAAADVFSAMTRRRDYRDNVFSADEATLELFKSGFPEQIITSILQAEKHK